MADHATIIKSLARVDKLVDDDVQYAANGAPLFRWLEISPIDVCNRKCLFCPKSDETVAPDQPGAVMQPILYEKLAAELQDLNYEGTVMLAGYGEPLLSRHIYDMVSAFSKVCNTEITTNGDPLTPKKIARLLEAGVHKLVVSLYDGPEQIDQMHSLFKEAGATENSYILRDRWYDEDEDYGLKLTNRGGTIDFGADRAHCDTPCYYPAYMMMIDWNGDVFLCTQDWNRRIKSGNLNYESLLKVWNSATLKRFRKQLHSGNRVDSPCKGCNADGKKHGEAHAHAWDTFYGQKGPRLREVF